MRDANKIWLVSFRFKLITSYQKNKYFFFYKSTFYTSRLQYEIFDFHSRPSPLRFGSVTIYLANTGPIGSISTLSLLILKDLKVVIPLKMILVITFQKSHNSTLKHMNQREGSTTIKIECFIIHAVIETCFDMLKSSEHDKL